MKISHPTVQYCVNVISAAYTTLMHERFDRSVRDGEGQAEIVSVLLFSQEITHLRQTVIAAPTGPDSVQGFVEAQMQPRFDMWNATGVNITADDSAVVCVFALEPED